MGDLLREGMSLTRQGECGKEGAETPDASMELPPTVGLDAGRANPATGLPPAWPLFFRVRTDTWRGEMRENSVGRGGASPARNRTEDGAPPAPSSRVRHSS